MPEYNNETWQHSDWNRGAQVEKSHVLFSSGGCEYEPADGGNFGCLFYQYGGLGWDILLQGDGGLQRAKRPRASMSQMQESLLGVQRTSTSTRKNYAQGREVRSQDGATCRTQ